MKKHELVKKKKKAPYLKAQLPADALLRGNHANSFSSCGRCFQSNKYRAYTAIS